MFNIFKIQCFFWGHRSEKETLTLADLIKQDIGKEEIVIRKCKFCGEYFEVKRRTDKIKLKV